LKTLTSASIRKGRSKPKGDTVPAVETGLAENIPHPLDNWAVAPAAAGYRIYRDGELLTTVAGNLTSYHDDAPMDVDLLYEMEAFNDYGVAVRVEARVPACR